MLDDWTTTTTPSPLPSLELVQDFTVQQGTNEKIFRNEVGLLIYLKKYKDREYVNKHPLICTANYLSSLCSSTKIGDF